MTEPHPLLQWFAVLFTFGAAIGYVLIWVVYGVLLGFWRVSDWWRNRGFVNDGFGRNKNVRK